MGLPNMSIYIPTHGKSFQVYPGDVILVNPARCLQSGNEHWGRVLKVKKNGQVFYENGTHEAGTYRTLSIPFKGITQYIKKSA